jgi:hypothetical protein
MKTKAIVATLLVAAASADARFAPPYPRKPLPPDESGYWIVINGNSWSHDVKSKLATPSPCRRGDRTGPAKNRRQLRKIPHLGEEISRFVKCRSSNA